MSHGNGCQRCDLMWCEHTDVRKVKVTLTMTLSFESWLSNADWQCVHSKRSQRKLLTAFDSAKEYRWLSLGLSRSGIDITLNLATPTWKFFSHAAHASSADRSHSTQCWCSCRSFHISRKSIPCRCCRFLRFQHRYFRHISTTLLKNWAHHSAWCLVGCIGTCCCWTRGERIINLQPTFSSLSSRLRSSSLNWSPYTWKVPSVKRDPVFVEDHILYVYDYTPHFCGSGLRMGQEP